MGDLDLPDDPEIVGRLVATAFDWMRAEAPEVASVLAPMSGDAWHDYRAMIAGYELPAFRGEPRNTAHLAATLGACGFRSFSEHWTKTLSAPALAMADWEPFRLRSLRRGYSFESVAPADLGPALDRAHALSLRVFADLPLFTPLPREDFRALYAAVGSRLEPGGLLFVRGPDGQDLGLAFAFREPDRPAELFLKSFGVLPGCRGLGLAPAFLAELYRLWLAGGVAVVHHCLMGSQESSARFDRGAGRVTRRYRLFVRSLSGKGAAGA